MSTKKFSDLKIALFYDWLNQWGGAEKVFLDLIKLFPQAEVFSLIHHPKKFPLKKLPHTSFVNRLPGALSHHRLYSPLYPLALEQFDFSDFDIVISTTTTFGHCLLTPPKTLFICYCHTPNRQIWQSQKLNFYQKIDFIFAQRPDYFIAGSKNSQGRIKRFFNRDSLVVYPGTNLSQFKPISNPKNNYFLIVSRLVPHKKVDLAIKACQQLNLPLKIVGTGRQLNQLKKLAKNKNIKFLGQVSQKKLIDLYQNCAALICPQHEDFGLTPIEAMACGKPVIALKKGGFLETILDQKTGLFFQKQSLSSLTKTLKKFTGLKLDPKACRRQARKFSTKSFVLNFTKTITSLWQLHQNTT